MGQARILLCKMGSRAPFTVGPKMQHRNYNNVEKTDLLLFEPADRKMLNTPCSMNASYG